MAFVNNDVFPVVAYQVFAIFHYDVIRGDCDWVRLEWFFPINLSKLLSHYSSLFWSAVVDQGTDLNVITNFPCTGCIKKGVPRRHQELIYMRVHKKR